MINDYNYICLNTNNFGLQLKLVNSYRIMINLFILYRFPIGLNSYQIHQLMFLHLL